MKIEIYGPGCAKCRQAYELVKGYVAENGLPHEVVKIESMDAMIALGVVSTPAIAVDGKVVLKGRVPTAGELKRLIG